MEPSDRTQALVDRLRANTLGALELYTLYLGERLRRSRPPPAP